MHKVLVRNCKYAVSSISNVALYCDVYVLLDCDDSILHYESIFLADLSTKNTIETVRNTANDLLSFARFTHQLGGFQKIKQRHLTSYLHGELFLNRQYKKSTMQRHIVSIKNFLSWLENKGYSELSTHYDWSFKHLYSKVQVDQVAYNSTQHSLNSLYIDKPTFYEKLLPSVKGNDAFIRIRDQIVLRLGYECGARAREVLSIDSKETRQAIFRAREKNNGLWATTSIKIIGKGAKYRDLLLPPDLSELIWAYLTKYHNRLSNNDNFLICKRDGTALQDPKHASTVFSLAWRNAEIKRVDRQGFHRLRKSYGTNLCQECYDLGQDPWVLLPRRLGHKSIETTKLYIQFDALRNNRSKVLSKLRMMDKKFSSIQGLRNDY